MRIFRLLAKASGLLFNIVKSVIVSLFNISLDRFAVLLAFHWPEACLFRIKSFQKYVGTFPGPGAMSHARIPQANKLISRVWAITEFGYGIHGALKEYHTRASLVLAMLANFCHSSLGYSLPKTGVCVFSRMVRILPLSPLLIQHLSSLGLGLDFLYLERFCSCV